MLETQICVHELHVPSSSSSCAASIVASTMTTDTLRQSSKRKLESAPPKLTEKRRRNVDLENVLSPCPPSQVTLNSPISQISATSSISTSSISAASTGTNYPDHDHDHDRDHDHNGRHNQGQSGGDTTTTQHSKGVTANNHNPTKNISCPCPFQKLRSKPPSFTVRSSNYTKRTSRVRPSPLSLSHDCRSFNQCNQNQCQHHSAQRPPPKQLHHTVSQQSIGGNQQSNSTEEVDHEQDEDCPTWLTPPIVPSPNSPVSDDGCSPVIQGLPFVPFESSPRHKRKSTHHSFSKDGSFGVIHNSNNRKNDEINVCSHTHNTFLTDNVDVHRDHRDHRDHSGGGGGIGGGDQYSATPSSPVTPIINIEDDGASPMTVPYDSTTSTPTEYDGTTNPLFVSSNNTVTNNNNCDVEVSNPALSRQCSTESILQDLTEELGLTFPQSISHHVYHSRYHAYPQQQTLESDKLLFETTLDGIQNLPSVYDNRHQSLWSHCPVCDGPKHPGDEHGFKHVGYPLTDDSGTVVCHIVKVKKGSSEFMEVAASMESCNFEDTGFEVLNVFRVQNQIVHKKFVEKHLSDELKPRATPIDCSPRQLFHVTRSKHLESLLVEGLDQRLASRGRFGRGLYFAEDPRKSNQYWKGSGSVRMMLRASVLLGHVKEYKANSIDPSLLREPKGYDSVQGELYGQREHVVYDSARVQIEYIITYKARGITLSPP